MLNYTNIIKGTKHLLYQPDKKKRKVLPFNIVVQLLDTKSKIYTKRLEPPVLLENREGIIVNRAIGMQINNNNPVYSTFYEYWIPSGSNVDFITDIDYAKNFNELCKQETKISRHMGHLRCLNNTYILNLAVKRACEVTSIIYKDIYLQNPNIRHCSQDFTKEHLSYIYENGFDTYYRNKVYGNLNMLCNILLVSSIWHLLREYILRDAEVNDNNVFIMKDILNTAECISNDEINKRNYLSAQTTEDLEPLYMVEPNYLYALKLIYDGSPFNIQEDDLSNISMFQIIPHHINDRLVSIGKSGDNGSLTIIQNELSRVLLSLRYRFKEYLNNISTYDRDLLVSNELPLIREYINICRHICGQDYKTLRVFYEQFNNIKNSLVQENDQLKYSLYKYLCNMIYKTAMFKLKTQVCNIDGNNNNSCINNLKRIIKSNSSYIPNFGNFNIGLCELSTKDLEISSILNNELRLVSVIDYFSFICTKLIRDLSTILIPEYGKITGSSIDDSTRKFGTCLLEGSYLRNSLSIDLSLNSTTVDAKISLNLDRIKYYLLLIMKVKEEIKESNMYSIDYGEEKLNKYAIDTCLAFMRRNTEVGYIDEYNEIELKENLRHLVYMQSNDSLDTMLESICACATSFMTCIQFFSKYNSMLELSNKFTKEQLQYAENECFIKSFASTYSNIYSIATNELDSQIFRIPNAVDYYNPMVSVILGQQYIDKKLIDECITIVQNSGDTLDYYNESCLFNYMNTYDDLDLMTLDIKPPKSHETKDCSEMSRTSLDDFNKIMKDVVKINGAVITTSVKKNCDITGLNRLSNTSAYMSQFDVSYLSAKISIPIGVYYQNLDVRAKQNTSENVKEDMISCINDINNIKAISFKNENKKQ